MYLKDFSNWSKNKIPINDGVSNNLARPREVRWAAIGVNVGSEIDGKNENFTRPVYIVSNAGADTCLVIPMSSKLKDIPGYYKIEIGGKEVSMCIHQIKVISKKRIFDRIENLSSKKHLEIVSKIRDYYNFNL